jgi:hypothetical protein
MPSEEALAYYARPDRVSLGTRHAAALAEAPTAVPELARWIQNLMLHEQLVGHYGQALTPERQAHSQRRLLDDVLDGIKACDPAPLADARDPGGRGIGVCSHFALLGVGVLRAHGIPARARCGFGMYFTPGKGVDHWVVELWNGARWQVADFQVDALQREIFKVGFDTLDQPAGKFLVPARAWQMCRAGDADPQDFGVFDEGGYWFIASSMVRDLASLNKVEMLPWDVWGAMLEPEDPMTQIEFDRFDRLAGLMLDPDGHFAALRGIYEQDGMRMPGEVFNANRQVRERAFP